MNSGIVPSTPKQVLKTTPNNLPPAKKGKKTPSNYGFELTNFLFNFAIGASKGELFCSVEKLHSALEPRELRRNAAEFQIGDYKVLVTEKAGGEVTFDIVFQDRIKLEDRFLTWEDFRQEGLRGGKVSVKWQKPCLAKRKLFFSLT